MQPKRRALSSVCGGALSSSCDAMQQHDAVPVLQPEVALGGLGPALQDMRPFETSPLARAPSGGPFVAGRDAACQRKEALSREILETAPVLFPQEQQQQQQQLPGNSRSCEPQLALQTQSSFGSSVCSSPFEATANSVAAFCCMQPAGAQRLLATTQHLGAPPVSRGPPLSSRVPELTHGSLKLQRGADQQQLASDVLPPQQQPVRYDSQLNMWVVVVPSKRSRHLLFASKFCVRKRGYAEARRRALASYQRFLQQRRAELPPAESAAAEERGPVPVSHPSMFFSRAKEVGGSQVSRWAAGAPQRFFASGVGVCSQAWCTQWYEGTKRIFKSFSCRVSGACKGRFASPVWGLLVRLLWRLLLCLPQVYGELAEPLCRWFLAAVRLHGRRPSLMEVESQFAFLRCRTLAEGGSPPLSVDCYRSGSQQLSGASTLCGTEQQDFSSEWAPASATLDAADGHSPAGCMQWQPQPAGSQQQMTALSPCGAAGPLAVVGPSEPLELQVGEAALAVHALEQTHLDAGAQPSATTRGSPAKTLHAAMGEAEVNKAAACQAPEDRQLHAAPESLPALNGFYLHSLMPQVVHTSPGMQEQKPQQRECTSNSRQQFRPATGGAAAPAGPCGGDARPPREFPSAFGDHQTLRHTRDRQHPQERLPPLVLAEAQP